MTKNNLEFEAFDIGPQEFSAAGALGCFEEKSSKEILEDLSEKSKEKRNLKMRKVLEESAGRGHGSVLDQNHFIFSIENLPRAATFQLCLPEYLEHLQQSLRRASAERGFYLPEEMGEKYEEVEDILSKSFDLYERMSDSGIPKEDARFILPLYTRTNIQTAGNARELMHLSTMNEEGEVPSIVQEVVDGMMEKAKKSAPDLFKDTGYNYEKLAFRPSSQLYSENKTINEIVENLGFPDNPKLLSYSGIKVDEKTMEKAVRERSEADLSSLKHEHFEFLVPNSLVAKHQLIRQRTLNLSGQSVYDSIKEGEMIIPPNIKDTGFEEEYKEQANSMLKLYKDLEDSGINKREAVGILPHSLKSYDLIHVDGWNALHFIGKRTCPEAQWEIRDKANQISEKIKETNPVIGKYSEPQCVTYQKCPEREPCGYWENYKKKHSLD